MRPIKARVMALEATRKARGDRTPISIIEVCHRDEHGVITLIETIELGHDYRKTTN